MSDQSPGWEPERMERMTSPGPQGEAPVTWARSSRAAAREPRQASMRSGEHREYAAAAVAVAGSHGAAGAGEAVESVGRRCTRQRMEAPKLKIRRTLAWAQAGAREAWAARLAGAAAAAGRGQQRQKAPACAQALVEAQEWLVRVRMKERVREGRSGWRRAQVWRSRRRPRRSRPATGGVLHRSAFPHPARWPIRPRRHWGRRS